MPRKANGAASAPVSGPDGYAGPEPDNSFDYDSDPGMVDLRIVEGRDDGEDDPTGPDFSPSGVAQYLLREQAGAEQVIAGPFDLNDEDTFDDALVEALRQHPWDDSPVYRVLILDPTQAPAIEELDEYLRPLLDEAWDTDATEHEDPDDWGNDSLGG